MALRNYLYAKHPDPYQTTLINRDPNMAPKGRSFVPRKHHMELRSEPQNDTSCPPERQLQLEDGTKVCANCADCVKKGPFNDIKPKIMVQMDDLSALVHDMTVEKDYTNAT